MGTLKSTADDMAGVYTLKFKDGKSQIDIQRAGLTSSCLLNVTVVGDAVRLQNVGSSTCDGNAYDDVQWRLDTDGLHFHLVSTQAVELKTLYESKPWQKVESWSDGLPPNGKWTVDLSADDLVRMGDLKSVAQDWAGQYTLTLKDGKSLGEYHAANGFYGKCQANSMMMGSTFIWLRSKILSSLRTRRISRRNPGRRLQINKPSSLQQREGAGSLSNKIGMASNG